MKMFIGGEWVSSTNGEVADVTNPGTGEILGEIPLGTKEDAQRAVEVAQEGKDGMASMPAHRRADLLFSLAEAIRAERDSLGELLAKENGKPITQTRAEVEVAARIFWGFGEEAKRIFGRVIPMDASPGQERHFALTIQQPIGVVAAIVPFNYPVELWAHKAAAALAAGNALITKPPTDCPLAVMRIVELMEEVGFPPLANQLVTGKGSVVGELLAESPGVQLISVTGSTATGRRIGELASKTLKRVHQELGANDAMIVLDDGDLEKAARAVVLGRLARGNGQICCAVKRIFVDQPAYEEFSDVLAGMTKQLKMGDQLLEDTDVGPLISEHAAEQAQKAVDEAVSAGAKVLAGGHRRQAFLEPTVLKDVPDSVEMMQEEVFGPIAPVVAFKDIDAAVELTNAVPYGLQAAVFTKDVTRAFDLAYRLHVGGVIINWSPALRVENLPFGGVKNTGQGREGIHDTLTEMTYQKSIVIHEALSYFDTGE